MAKGRAQQIETLEQLYKQQGIPLEQLYAELGQTNGKPAYQTSEQLGTSKYSLETPPGYFDDPSKSSGGTISGGDSGAIPWWARGSGPAGYDLSDPGGGGGSGGGGPGGAGQPSAGRQPFFTPSSGPQPGEINMDLLARQILGPGGGQGATGLAARGIRMQEADLDRMKRFEDEKMRLMGEQEKRAFISPEATESAMRRGREGVRGAQAARGVFTSGAGVEQEAYLLPQIEQALQAWQLGALSDISSQLDPLIQSTATRAAMYNIGSMFGGN